MKPIYYYKLWRLLAERRITQAELTQRSGVSTATLSRMHAGEQVSLDVIARLCLALDCDIADLITLSPSAEDAPDYALSGVQSEVISEALARYMEAQALSVYDIVIATGLSRNTVKAILRGKAPSPQSRRKLCALGAKFLGAIKGEPERKNARSDHHGEAK